MCHLLPLSQSDLFVDARAEIHGLVVRPALNNKLCTLLRFHKDVERWQVQVDGLTEVLRVRAYNLRRDRIEIVPVDGPVSCIMRPLWPNPQDADETAQHVLVEYVILQALKNF